MSRRISEYVDHEAYQSDATDDRGEPIDDWLPAVQVGIYGFDPGATSEPREGMDRVVVEPTIYVPTGVAFAPADRVTVRGRLYQVEGETREWWHPDGHRPGNVISLRRVEG